MAEIDPHGQESPEGPGLRPFGQRRRIFRQRAGGVDGVVGVRSFLGHGAWERK